jgi:hypothetical protein
MTRGHNGRHVVWIITQAGSQERWQFNLLQVIKATK